VDINNIVFRPSRQEYCVKGRNNAPRDRQAPIRQIGAAESQDRGRGHRGDHDRCELRREAVSVSIEDIALSDWVEKVYKPDIIGRPDTLYKTPGYDLR